MRGRVLWSRAVVAGSDPGGLVRKRPPTNITVFFVEFAPAAKIEGWGCEANREMLCKRCGRGMMGNAIPGLTADLRNVRQIPGVIV